METLRALLLAIGITMAFFLAILVAIALFG